MPKMRSNTTRVLIILVHKNTYIVYVYMGGNEIFAHFSSIYIIKQLRNSRNIIIIYEQFDRNLASMRPGRLYIYSFVTLTLNNILP